MKTIAMQMCRDESVSVPAKTACLLICYIARTSFTWEEAASLLELYRNEDILRACVLQNTNTGLGRYYFGRDDEMIDAMSQIENPRQLYERFKLLAQSLPEKEVKIGHPIFSWLDIPLSSQKVWEIMIVLARNSLDQEWIDDLVAMAGQMPLDVRSVFVNHILEFLTKVSIFDRKGFYGSFESEKKYDKELRENWPESELQRSTLFAMLQDKSMSIRTDALDIIAHRDLTEGELIQIENLLSLKTSAIRQVALGIIQKSGKVKQSAQRLRDSGNAAKIQAANELDPSQQEKAAANLVDKAHGFGLYRPDIYWDGGLPDADPQWHPAELLHKYLDKLNAIFVELNELVKKYKDTEFVRTYGDTKETVTIDSVYGNLDSWYLRSIDYCPDLIDCNQAAVVLPEVWNEFCDKQKFTVQELMP